MLVRLIAAIVFSLAASARAEEAILRLTDVVDEGRRQNPELQAARERARAASYMPAQASAYDDPMFTHEAWNVPDSLNVGHADNNILSLSQRLPFPGKKTLAGRVTEGDAEVAKRDADRVEVDVVANAKRAYYGLWQAHQELAIYSRDRELVGEFSRIARELYAVGSVGQADALRSQVELTRLINRVSTAALAVQTARAELTQVLGRGSEAVDGIPESPTEPNLDEKPDRLVELALENRPEIAGQQAEIARTEQAVRLARLNYLPDLELRASRFVNFREDDGFGAEADFERTVAVMVMGLLPIMWAHGTGSDVMKRIAAPMIGGILTSFVLELVVYPAIYAIWRRREVGPGATTTPVVQT